MNAKQFKDLAYLIVKADKARNTYPLNVEFLTKRQALDWLSFTGSEIDFLKDNDCHVYVCCGDKHYSDEEITHSILANADYIELSYAEGYSFYIGRKCNEKALENEFWASLGWHLNDMIEFNEISDDILEKIAQILGITVKELIENDF